VVPSHWKGSLCQPSAAPEQYQQAHRVAYLALPLPTRDASTGYAASLLGAVIGSAVLLALPACLGWAICARRGAVHGGDAEMLERGVGGVEGYLHGYVEARRGFRARVPINMLTKGVTGDMQISRRVH
jgi:hypothetical protein